MLNKVSREDRIKRNIFILPIFSIVVLSIVIYSVLAIYINNFKDKEIKKLKQNLINRQKKIAKNRVQELIDEIKREIKDLNENTEKFLKLRIKEASSIIDNVIQNNPNRSEKDIKKIIKEVLSAIRYNNGRGYYYVYDYKTKIMLVHPLKKYVGFNLKYLKDKKGNLIIKDDEKIFKENSSKGGFIHLFFAKPDQPNKEFEKINYIKYIEKLDWVIGTGEYIKDAKKELQYRLLKRFEKRRYGDDQYFWIHNTNYKLLMHPYRSSQVGKNDENLTDNKEQKIVKLFVNGAKKNPNGTFIDYCWERPNHAKPEQKLGYIKLFKEWNWIIETGIYLDKIQKTIDKSKRRIETDIHKLYATLLLIILFSLFFVSNISYYLSKQSGKLFNIYKNDLEGKIQKAVAENMKKDKLLQQQSKLASMGEMIGNIAHQWRQPLNALNINIQNLDDDYADGLIDEKFLEKFIKKNRKIIEFMSNTIDDFRNFFRIDKKKSKFFVKKAIEHVLSIQSAVLKNHNISLEIIGDDFEIDGFESEFKQVMLNLINNAKDALIEKQIANPKITIKLSKNKIEVIDNAKGIPKDIIDRVFEPYFTTKEQGKGTGMGLYMSKVIIETNMKGSLSAKNIEGGASFTIEFF